MSEVGDAAARLRHHGWCLVPDVLSATRTAEVRERLWQAAERSRALLGDRRRTLA